MWLHCGDHGMIQNAQLTLGTSFCPTPGKMDPVSPLFLHPLCGTQWDLSVISPQPLLLCVNLVKRAWFILAVLSCSQCLWQLGKSWDSHTGELGREGEDGSLDIICICLWSSVASPLSWDLASLRCEHRRIWKPSSLPLSFLTLLVPHPNLSAAYRRMTGKAQMMGVGHQSSLCTRERAWSSPPHSLLPAVWSVIELTDGHSALWLSLPWRTHLECHCVQGDYHPSPSSPPPFTPRHS